MFVQAIKRVYKYECVYMCYLQSTLRPDMCVSCGRSNVRMCVRCARSQEWVYVCVYVCHFTTLSNSYLCVCVYMYVNTAERIQLQNAVILLLIMLIYFVLKIVSYPHTTTPSNLISM